MMPEDEEVKPYPYYTFAMAAFARKLDNIEPIESSRQKPTKEHLAWMLRELSTFDQTSVKHAVKAGRWIGWMLLAAEMFGFWDNEQSRVLIRKDKEHGFDLPRANKHA